MDLKNLRSTFIYGPMKSGKSELLIEIIEALILSCKPFVTFKPSMDTRDRNFIKSRNPLAPQIESVVVHDASDIEKYLRLLDSGKNKFLQEVERRQSLEGQAKGIITIKEYMRLYNNVLRYVIIDEVFMLDSKIIKVKENLETKGTICIFSGLLHDFRKEYFPLKDYSHTGRTVEDIMDAFDSWMFLVSNCDVCGKPAEHTQRLTDGVPSHRDEPVLQIGDLEYEARCSNCHELPAFPQIKEKKKKRELSRTNRVA